MSRNGSLIAVILSAAAMLLGGAALAVAIASYSRNPEPSASPLDRRVSALDHAIADSQRHEQQDASQAAANKRDAQRVGKRMAKVLSCLPELEAQINGISANVSDGSVWITNNQQVSTYCSSTLYGGRTGGD